MKLEVGLDAPLRIDSRTSANRSLRPSSWSLQVRAFNLHDAPELIKAFHYRWRAIKNTSGGQSASIQKPQKVTGYRANLPADNRDA